MSASTENEQQRHESNWNESNSDLDITIKRMALYQETQKQSIHHDSIKKAERTTRDRKRKAIYREKIKLSMEHDPTKKAAIAIKQRQQKALYREKQRLSMQDDPTKKPKKQ